MSDKYHTFGEVSIVLESHKEAIVSQKEILIKHDEQIGKLLIVTERMLLSQTNYNKTTKILGAIMLLIIGALITYLINNQTDFLKNYKELMNGRSGKINSGIHEDNRRNKQTSDNEDEPVSKFTLSEFIKPDNKIPDKDGVLRSSD